MATLRDKIAAEHKVRQLLETEDVSPPDRLEYGFTCIRLYWFEPKIVLVVDIDGSVEEDLENGVKDVDVAPHDT